MKAAKEMAFAMRDMAKDKAGTWCGNNTIFNEYMKLIE